MASPAVLDVENLLAPIVGDDPCGRDPRSDLSPAAPFLVVKDAYDLAREAERRIDRGFDPDQAAEANETRQRVQHSWATVCERGPEIIATIGKDLRVAVWLTEALLRQRRLGGLRDGLLLAAGLVERYWDGLFPQPEPEPDAADEDPRLFAFGALRGAERECRVAAPLYKLALSDGGKGEPVSLWEYQERRQPSAADAAAVSIDDRLRQSATDFKRDLVEDAEACIAAADALERALAARCGRDAPQLSGLRALAGAIGQALRPHVGDLPAAAEPMQPPPEVLAAPVAEAAPPPPVRPGGNGLDRESAFRQLAEIAAFFRRTEPHSPIAYAIENIVRRGRMTLPELLRELISDEAARDNYFITAGMQPPDKSG